MLQDNDPRRFAVSLCVMKQQAKPGRYLTNEGHDKRRRQTATNTWNHVDVTVASLPHDRMGTVELALYYLTL